MDKITLKKDLDLEIGHICTLGGTILDKNPLTMHHLIPVRRGGQTILVNITWLCRLEHDMFNIIEANYQEKADMINEYFKDFKTTKDMMMLMQMRKYVLFEVDNLGYVVEDRGKILTLRRR